MGPNGSQRPEWRKCIRRTRARGWAARVPAVLWGRETLFQRAYGDAGGGGGQRAGWGYGLLGEAGQSAPGPAADSKGSRGLTARCLQQPRCGQLGQGAPSPRTLLSWYEDHRPDRWSGGSLMGICSLWTLARCASPSPLEPAVSSPALQCRCPTGMGFMPEPPPSTL